MPAKKYRPYLTLEELKALQGFCASCSPSGSLHRYISRYIDEIQNGYRKVNHTLKPDIAETLGFAHSEKSDADRYANDLMSPEEESIYEQQQGISS